MNTKTTGKTRLDTRKVKILQLQRDVRNLDIIEQSGFSPSEISRHIQGDGRREAVLKAIAKALGVCLAEIILNSEPAEADQSSAA